MRSQALRIAALLAVFAGLYWLTPPSLPVCGFRWLTGRPCPLCGLTRAMFALAKGHWREAVGFNALTPLGFAMLFLLFWNHPVRARVWSAGIVLFGIYGVWRVI